MATRLQIIIFIALFTVGLSAPEVEAKWSWPWSKDAADTAASAAAPPATVSTTPPVELPYYDLIPTLETDEQKLRYLFYIRRFIPAIFEEAASFDVDLFELLNNEGALLKQLIAENPEYRAALASRSDLLRISADTNGERQFINVQIDERAIAEWRQNLVETLEYLEKGGVEGTSVRERIFNAVEAEQAKLRAPNFKGFAAALLRKMNPDERAAIMSNPNAEAAAQSIRNFIIANGLPKGFKPDLLGLPKDSNQATILDRLDELARAAGSNLDPKIAIRQRIGALITLYTYGASEREFPLKEEDIRAKARFSAEELRSVTDPDIYKPKAEEFARAYSTNGRKLSEKEARSIIGDFGNFFAERTIETRTVSVGSIRLTELSPDIGICRGLLGDDCSTQYSFPFPNDPDERVFAITDGDGKSLGYISGTIVEADGKLQFYAITTSGKRLTKQHVWMVLNALNIQKEKLGVEGILLPQRDRLVGLLNFKPVREAYLAASSGRSENAISIKYRNPELRTTMETYVKSTVEGIVSYDSMGTNTAALPFLPDSSAATELITSTEMIPNRPPSLPTLTRGDVFEFALDLAYGGRKKEMHRIAKILAIDLQDINRFVAVLENENGLAIEEYENSLRSALRDLGLPEDLIERKAYLLDGGRMRAPNALAEEHIKGTSEILLRYARDEGLKDLLLDNNRSDLGDVIADLSRRIKDEDSLAHLASWFRDKYPKSLPRLQQIHEQRFSKALTAVANMDETELASLALAPDANAQERMLAQLTKFDQILQTARDNGLIGYYADIPEGLARIIFSENDPEIRKLAIQMIKTVRAGAHRSDLRTTRTWHKPYGAVSGFSGEYSETELFDYLEEKLRTGELDSFFGIEASDPIPGRVQALQRIFNRGADERAVKLLANLTTHKDNHIRVGAIKLLGFQHALQLGPDSEILRNRIRAEDLYERIYFYASMADGAGNPELYETLLSELEVISAEHNAINGQPYQIYGRKADEIPPRITLSSEHQDIHQVKSIRYHLSRVIAKHHIGQLTEDILTNAENWPINRLRAFLTENDHAIPLFNTNIADGKPFYAALWEDRLAKAIANPDPSMRLVEIENLGNFMIEFSRGRSISPAPFGPVQISDIIRRIQPLDESALDTIIRLADSARNAYVLRRETADIPQEIGAALLSNQPQTRQKAIDLLQRLWNSPLTMEEWDKSRLRASENIVLVNIAEILQSGDYEALLDKKRLSINLEGERSVRFIAESVIGQILETVPIRDPEFHRFLVKIIFESASEESLEFMQRITEAGNRSKLFAASVYENRGIWFEAIKNFSGRKSPRSSGGWPPDEAGRLWDSKEQMRSRAIYQIISQHLEDTPLDTEFTEFLRWAERFNVLSSSHNDFYETHGIRRMTNPQRKLANIKDACLRWWSGLAKGSKE